jgi:hypothetical protein
MATKKRCKAYRPKQIVMNPLNYLFGGLKRIDPDNLVTLNCQNHAALATIVSGRGTRATWDKLTGCINMALIMCEYGTGDEYRTTLEGGREALIALGRRYLKHGKFAFTGDELTAINEAMAVHDAQLVVSRVIDVERADAEIERRLRHHINTFNVTTAGT